MGCIPSSEATADEYKPSNIAEYEVTSPDPASMAIMVASSDIDLVESQPDSSLGDRTVGAAKSAAPRAMRWASSLKVPCPKSIHKTARRPPPHQAAVIFLHGSGNTGKSIRKKLKKLGFVNAMQRANVHLECPSAKPRPYQLKGGQVGCTLSAPRWPLPNKPTLSTSR